MTQNNQLSGHLAALFTVIIWGTTFISTKLLLQSFQPIEILFYRFCLGLIALLLVYPKRLNVTQRRQELYFAAAGLSGVTLYFLLENISLTYTLASNAGVIVSVTPFFTGLMSRRFLDGEKPGAQFYIGFLAAIAGVFLISFNGASVLHLNPIGDILALLAAVVWSVYSILTRKISAFGYNTIQTTRRIFFYGVLFMIPALFLMQFKAEPQRFALPVNLFNILYLGLGASAVCFVTWSLAVRRLGAVKTSVYIYSVPVITVITSAIVLNEPVTPIAIAGTALILVGLVLSEIRLPLKRKGKENRDSVRIP